MERDVTDAELERAAAAAYAALKARMQQKGRRPYHGKHEMLGVLTEEYFETVEAVHSKQHARIREELLDVAVTAIFGIASADAGWGR
jgi:NTP pyrophosphatase (non-canonical NTP hydrolase)